MSTRSSHESPIGHLQTWWVSRAQNLISQMPAFHRYFGFITKHPADHRFACHVFVSEDSTKALAESVGYVCTCVCVRVCARAVFMLSCQHHPCPLVLEAPILEEAGRSQEAQALDHSLLISHWSSSPLGPFSLGSNCPEDS